MTEYELAKHVVDNMDYNCMYESAITGVYQMYKDDPDKFKEDMSYEGFTDE